MLSCRKYSCVLWSVILCQSENQQNENAVVGLIFYCEYATYCSMSVKILFVALKSDFKGGARKLRSSPTLKRE